jgi:hypothetical protein
MGLKLSKEDTEFLVKSFWVVAPFTLAWDIIAHYRSTITTPVSLAFVGNVSHAQTVLMSLPVLSICLWVLCSAVVLYASCTGHDRGRFVGRILPIFGAVSDPLRYASAILLFFALVLPIITTTHLLAEMHKMEMVSLKTHLQLTGDHIFEFQGPSDWRWHDTADVDTERPTGFPGWQPWIYRFMVIANYFALVCVVLSVVLPSFDRHNKTLAEEEP